MINLDTFFARNPLEITDAELKEVIQQEREYFAEFMLKKAAKKPRGEKAISLEDLGNIKL